jgi:RNA polymerase sigma factor (sigma-70 family)
LSQIARHVGANWRRRHRLRVVEDAGEPTAAPEAPPPWPLDADRHGLSEEVARALASLPEAARACLLLHVITEHTFAEIGEMLDLPPNTVASHVRRARFALREALAPAEPQPESP